jgi:hypothetical protein
MKYDFPGTAGSNIGMEQTYEGSEPNQRVQACHPLEIAQEGRQNVEVGESANIKY